MKVTRDFSTRQRLGGHAARQLELMTEEVIGIMGSIAQSGKAKLWIEGSGLKYRIHLNFPASIGSEEYKKLISLSSSGKNEAVNTLSDRIREKMIAGIKSADSSTENSTGYEWSLRDGEQGDDDLGESILSALADNIKVSVTRSAVELVVIKSVKE